MPTPALRCPQSVAQRAAAVLAIATVAALPPLQAGAQGGTPPSPADAPSRPRVLARRDLLTLGIAAAAAGALTTADGRIARWSQGPAVPRTGPVRGAAATFRVLGDPGVALASGVLYASGLAARDRALADVGLHTGAAIVAGGLTTGLLKGLVGRARPYVSGDRNPGDVALGRGFRRGNAYASFPSGHATAAFAFAGALAAEGRERWPSRNRVVAPLAYTGASLVALSRIYHDRHWASDVVAGAGIGLVAGHAVVRYQHARPRNRIDGRLLPAGTAAPRWTTVPATLGWTFTF